MTHFPRKSIGQPVWLLPEEHQMLDELVEFFKATKAEVIRTAIRHAALTGVFKS
jgi:hypothetical protein